MSENNEHKVNGVSTEEPEIFGRSKSAEEIKAEKAAEKAAKRAAERELRARLRQEKKNAPKASRKEQLTVAGILVLVVVLLLGALAVQFASSKKAEQYDQDESMSYFVDNESVPELSKDGIKGVITECYYTKGGFLCVKMLLSNGMDAEQHLQDIMVEIANMSTKATIASGYTDAVAASYSIPAGGTNTYTLYISPEHVLIRDDTLAELEYTITTTAVPVA